MKKQILRIISLAMAFFLLICVLPQPETSAAQSEEYRITQQVESTYKAALKYSGRSSFRGYCGASLNCILYKLGIITKIVGANGNEQYDLYKNEAYSSGGYRIRAYSAYSYTLKEALNAITDGGTKNAYNILVGFQRSNTYAGQRYGHCVFIHAVINGVVYFAESFPCTIGGVDYDEGECISVGIEQFCKYYNNWTTLDGLIHFGLKTYNDLCEEYPAYLFASVTEETQMYTAPCLPQVDDRAIPMRTLQPGERLSVTGLLLNTEGEYWYQVEDYQTGYVRADATEVQSMRYDDITATGLSAPTVHRQGNTYNIKGNVSSIYNHICSIRAQVFTVSGEELTHVMTTTEVVADNHYSLSYSTVSNRMAFRLLSTGAYRYELAVVVSNYYYADGELCTEWKTIKLYMSNFRVVNQTGGTVTVTYDACGGTSALNAAVLAQGQTLNTLPEATREGHVFAGWYTEAEGGTLVTEDYVLSKSVTLYARWEEPANASGWYEENGRSYYVMDGQRIVGFFQVDGITYYQDETGFLSIGWVEVNGLRYYFNANGAMAIGWLELDGCRYYLGVDGTAIIGWYEIDGNYYYFNENGLMLTGKQIIDGVECLFGEDGALIVE